MTLTHFKLLSTAEQTDYLSKMGKCHFSRMTGCYYINEFVLEGFTAEVWYDTSLGYVERITAHPILDLLELKRTDHFASRDIPIYCKTTSN